MNDQRITTLSQVRSFLDGTQAIEFSLRTQSERYDFVRRTLIRFAYHTLSKPDKGLLLTFLAHVSGYSRVQVKRLARRWLKDGRLRHSIALATAFLAPTPMPINACWPSSMNCMAPFQDPQPKSSVNAPGGFLNNRPINAWPISLCHTYII